METLVSYAMSWIGTPYLWGGDDHSGWDCSGFVQEILASVGEDPPGDQTSEGLYRYFLEAGRPLAEPEAGALAFYGPPDKIIHVALCIDWFRVIEASGGGRKTRTEADAKRDNAYVRIRPFDHRRDIRAILMPTYRSLEWGPSSNGF